MSFLHDCWYMVVWAADIPEGGVMAFEVIGEPLVVYRGASGRLVVLEDRCCHKLAPLSLGRVERDDLRCMYHGLKYGADGRCNQIPGRADVPGNIRVRSYPAEEAHSALWVWMGDPARADPALIPPFQGVDHPEWAMLPGQMDFDAHYSLINENLLDLSHVPFLHEACGGDAELAAFDPDVNMYSVPEQVEELDRGLRITRAVENAPVAPMLRGEAGDVADNWTVNDFLAPGIFLLTVELFPPGSIAAAGGSRPADALLLNRNFTCQAVTPRTERASRYFWALGSWRRSAVAPELFAAMGKLAFDQDKPMIDAQQRIIDMSPDVKPRLLHMDKFGIIFQSIMLRLIEQEQSVAARAEGAPAAA